ncbi:hypothetical protein D1BOALGB6SA_8790 [Olavius sp. associated proteobacterium Delta 1]|nr:hypothetical protein D1BOALGB6SA_8790 [Olavius sp. associated proteobacterium Delta 1]
MGLDKSVSPEFIHRLMRPFVKQMHEEVDERNRKSMPKPKIEEERLSYQETFVLRVLAEAPFLTFSALRERTQYFEDMDIIVRNLANLGLLLPSKGITKTRPAMYFPLTEKAYDSLETPKSRCISPERFHHTMWCWWLKKALDRQGNRAIREFGKKGVKGRIDVYCKDTDTAYEVTRSFKNLVGNVIKCLRGFRVKKVVVVCESQKVCKRAKALVEQKLSPDLKEKVEYESIRKHI